MEHADRYSSVDRLLHRLAFATAGIQLELADVEELVYRRQLAGVRASRPVFITALPRAGTTILLELLSDLDQFASHCYRDMPFVLLPLAWNSFSRVFRRTVALTERAHGDGILVGGDSSEAFEEMFWKVQWPDHYLPDRILPWASCTKPEAAEAFTSHMRKVIALRRRNGDITPRYLSKNNGNIARLPLLEECWPDAVIVVPVREPVQHAASLLRQHRRFLDIHSGDPFAREYMKGIGHFDFDGWLASARHTDPLTIGFWLEYWVAAYAHVLGNRTRVRFLPYDQFCAHPAEGLYWLAETLGLSDSTRLVASRAGIHAPPAHEPDLSEVPAPLLARATELHRALVRCTDLGAGSRGSGGSQASIP